MSRPSPSASSFDELPHHKPEPHFLDGMMALVSVDGNWVPATPEQWAAIVKGEELAHHQLVYFDVKATVGLYEYVICAEYNDGVKSYIRNIKYGTCRAVMLVSKPKVWQGPKNPEFERRR